MKKIEKEGGVGFGREEKRRAIFLLFLKGDSVGKRENRKEKERSIRESKKKTQKIGRFFCLGVRKKWYDYFVKGRGGFSFGRAKEKCAKKKIVNRKPRL